MNHQQVAKEWIDSEGHLDADWEASDWAEKCVLSFAAHLDEMEKERTEHGHMASPMLSRCPLCVCRENPQEKVEEDRFARFNPAERTVLRVLLQNHANSVSEIALNREEVRVSSYIAIIEALENEICKPYHE